jgi:predicted transcriptional regulator
MPNRSGASVMSPLAIDPDALRDARVAAGLSLDDAAGALRRSPRTIDSVEAGSQRPSIDVVMAMSDLYGCSLDSLVKRVRA